MPDCQQCGDCCRNNGLIPPYIARDVRDQTAESPDAPGWLVVLVYNLRTQLADVAEDYHCVFLTEDNRCAIHDVAKPDDCCGFSCDKITDEVNDDPRR